ncbi:MAG: tRNA (adenosine(37)-N6)-threonylcarbamoyltransferase complex dimerization subunit type 1 TsaB [Bacilli bacterium]|jgi:tRNA threonylcarbamoyl adenosine modification protein YeaZ
MIRLLLDSSGGHLAVGLAHQNRVIAATRYYAWQRQSEKMVPEIVSLLKKYNLSFGDIEAVHVAIGPGSYTGVRIALTIAKIIGYALKIPVFPVSSLAILKSGEEPTICLINARSERSYVGVYQGQRVLVTDCVMTNEEVRGYIKDHPDYRLGGDIGYLNLEGTEPDLFINLLGLATGRAPIEDIHALKPVYLKENL